MDPLVPNFRSVRAKAELRVGVWPPRASIGDAGASGSPGGRRRDEGVGGGTPSSAPHAAAAPLLRPLYDATATPQQPNSVAATSPASFSNDCANARGLNPGNGELGGTAVTPHPGESPREPTSNTAPLPRSKIADMAASGSDASCFSFAATALIFPVRLMTTLRGRAEPSAIIRGSSMRKNSGTARARATSVLLASRAVRPCRCVDRSHIAWATWTKNKAWKTDCQFACQYASCANLIHEQTCNQAVHRT
ncbi:hypothetical protein Vafri_1164 [Volvox africanus]|nr:hypothetical protein Vafri_1164 [Volvox africanus]